eukprot:3972741-Prymnesium_polylepis.1
MWGRAHVRSLRAVRFRWQVSAVAHSRAASVSDVLRPPGLPGSCVRNSKHVPLCDLRALFGLWLRLCASHFEP